MSAATFSQATVVHALCLALAQLTRNGAPISAGILAAAVADTFPTVPGGVLRVLAARVLRLHFDPIAPDDEDLGCLDAEDAAATQRFLAAADLAAVDADVAALDRLDPEDAISALQFLAAGDVTATAAGVAALGRLDPNVAIMTLQLIARMLAAERRRKGATVTALGDPGAQP